MAYSKQNFQNGQILNAANLEVMENGIIAGQGARNLLVNSDFRNPIDIDNKIGTTNVDPCFTRWNITRASSSITTQIIKIDNGIRVYKNGGVVRFYQSCNYNLLGKTVSYAVGTAEGIFVGSCSVSTSSVFTRIGTHTGYLSVYHSSESGKTIFSIYFNDNSEDAIDLYWAALYEGAYTKETLPNYVPNLGLEENILSQVITQPENFVLNNNFIDPINSQFQTTYTNNVSSSTTFYTIDKWELSRWSTDGSGTAALTLRSDGIYLHGGTDSNNKPNSCNLYQIIDVNDKMQGMPFTAVLHTTISTHDNTALFRIWDADTSDTFGQMNVKTGYNIINFTIPSTCSRLAIGFGTMASYGGHGQISIVAQYAALYKGKYTIENLPTYIPYTKQMEMLRCGIPTSPRNVLKNSNFTNPLNTKGFSSINSGAYTTIDCWNSWISGTGGKIELTSSGIKLSPPSSENIGIYQQIENYQLNKIYTVVVYINNLPYLKRFQMGNYGVGTKLGPIYFYSIPSANVLIRINSTDSAVTIQKVALYEGAYTLDTIPMYQSESKHIEMLNCNVPLAPYNLLDNSDFTNPIAQAGLNGMHGSAKYVCDRWISWDADATFGSGYITPGSPIDQRLSKTVVDINKTYTAAICLSDGTIKAESGTFSNGFGSYPLGIYCMKQEGSTDYVTVRLNTGNNIRWAALYEGSYTADTLPAYQPKGYAAELAECLRYYENSWFGVKKTDTQEYFAHIWSAQQADARIEFKQQKRISPTITFYPIGTESNWKIFNGSYQPIDNVENRGRGGLSGFIARVTKGSADGTTWTVGSTIQAQGHWEASADL